MFPIKSIKKVFHSIFKGTFTKNVAIVAGGTTLTQLLGVVFSPIVSRLYSPEEFGILSVYSAVLSMIAISSSLKFEWGIPIAESDEKATNVAALSFSVLLVITSVIALLLIIPNNKIIGKVIGHEIVPYRLFIPVGVFLTGIHNILMQIGYRNRGFKVIAKTKLTQVLAGNGTKIGLGAIGVGPIGLILGSIFSASAGSFTLVKSFALAGKYRLNHISFKEIKWCAKRYKNFPKFSAPSQILNTAGLSLPKIFLASLYGLEVTGAFGFALGIISLPVQLIGNSVGDVFYSEAARIGNTDPKRLKRLSIQLFKKLLIIGFFPFITLVLFGPFLFSFVFGVQWVVAGRYAQILSILVYARLVFMPVSRVFAVLEKQKVNLFIDIFRVVIVTSTFLICKMLALSALLTISIYTIGMIIVYLITFIVAQAIMKKRINLAVA